MNINLFNQFHIKRKARSRLSLLEDFLIFLMIIMTYVFKNYTIQLYLFEIFFIVVYFFILQKYDIKLNSFIIWSFALIFFSLFSSLYAVSSIVSVKQTIVLAKGLILSNILLIYLIKNPKGEKIFLNALLVSFLIIVFLAIKNIPVDSLFKTRIGNQIMLNPNDLANKLAITLFLLTTTRHIGNLFISFPVYSTLLLITLLTGSRKALLLLLIIYPLYFIILSNDFKKILKNYFIVFMSFVSLIYLVLKNSFLYNVIGVRMIGLINYLLGIGVVDNSTLERATMISNGLDLFFQKPFLGYGIHNYGGILTEVSYSHNNYIEILVGMGIIGGIIYYSLYYVIFIRTLRKKESLALAIPLVIGLLFLDLSQVTYYTEFYLFILSYLYYLTLEKGETIKYDKKIT